MTKKIPVRIQRVYPFLLALATLALLGLASAQVTHVAYAPSPYDPRVEYGVSGGMRDATRAFGFDYFGDLCSGYVYSSPDHVLALSNAQPSFTLEVESSGDTTLVVRHRESGRTFCDDDSGYGSDAMLSITNWPRGTYDVYVGSYWQGDYHPYTLYMSR